MSTTHKHTVRTFIDLLNVKNYTALLGLLGDGFTHTFLPASLRMPVRNKTQLSVLFKDIDDTILYFNMGFKSEPLQDGNTVVAHTSANGKTVGGNPYTNEYIMIFALSENGKEITWMEEFVDSKYLSDMLVKEVAARVQ